MKSGKYIILYFLLITSISSTAFAQIVVLSNGEWEPYLSQNLKHYGVASHIVTESFALQGIYTEYEWYDAHWKRAYKDALDGKVNGSLVWSPKPEREAEMYYSDVVISGNEVVFFHLKELKFDWNTIDDLKGKIIGGTLGYTYGQKFDYAEKKGLIQVMLVKEEMLNFNVLLKKRIDLFVVERKVGEALLEKHFSLEDRKKITFHKKPIRVATYHMLLAKNNPVNKDLMVKFNKGLRKLKSSGKYDQYINDSELGKYSKSYVAPVEPAVVKEIPVEPAVAKEIPVEPPVAKESPVEPPVTEDKTEIPEIQLVGLKLVSSEPNEISPEDISLTGNSKADSSNTKKKRRYYLLLNGSQGKSVEKLQQILASKGYYLGEINGVFDSELDTSVIKFQKDNNLEMDGIVGPLTRAALGKF